MSCVGSIAELKKLSSFIGHQSAESYTLKAHNAMKAQFQYKENKGIGMVQPGTPDSTLSALCSAPENKINEMELNFNGKHQFNIFTPLVDSVQIGNSLSMKKELSWA